MFKNGYYPPSWISRALDWKSKTASDENVPYGTRKGCDKFHTSTKKWSDTYVWSPGRTDLPDGHINEIVYDDHACNLRDAVKLNGGDNSYLRDANMSCIHSSVLTSHMLHARTSYTIS